jgi:cobaltochelatase CobN
MPGQGEFALPAGEGPVAVILFYRSHLLAGDTAPVTALAAALAARGLAARALFVDSLKQPEAAAFVAARLRDWRPAVVLNATGFSAPLEQDSAPVLQLVLAGSDRAAWQASARGLSPADLAMQVVLPELDGRLLTTAISFKAEAAPVAGLDFAPRRHVPDQAGIALAADRAAGWARLAGTPRAERRVAIVLSDYPGGETGHAVGLDSFASLHAILCDLAEAGFDCASVPDLPALTAALTGPAATRIEYAQNLPPALRARIAEGWGPPPETVTIRALQLGRITVAVQPDRGSRADRKSGYHDPDLPPCHAYVAFYLWLRGLHAMVHLGTHGTLEWLPGKAVALGAECLPAALTGGLPVIYPFIVNNPGEAAVAKRRLGAVTIGHLTPPLRPAGLSGAALELERLLDEYAAASGMDRRRATLLRRDIVQRAAAAGLLAEADATEDALARLDATLCDLKEMQIQDGLHVFGRAPDSLRRAAFLETLAAACPETNLAARLDACAAAERAALLAALDGQFVAPGPAGAPTRGRADVLPTGRNLTTTDPRAIPTQAAMTLAARAADVLLDRHRQDHGDWPRRLVIDAWGSATLRTGGESLALAFVLMGVRPVWDAGSGRASGVEILPLALLDRPRVDVTLRVSGLFRDAFEAQMTLFDRAVQALAAREEDPAWNPLAGVAAPVRMFGAAHGAYGAGGADRLADARRPQLAAAYLAASATAYGSGASGGFAQCVAAADGYVHPQDHAEGDLLDNFDQALHAGGFAAAAASLGAAPALYLLDTAGAPRARTVREAVARAARGRAANPRWIAGQLAHGYRGAAEIARAASALHAFAVLLGEQLDTEFDLLFDATLGTEAVARFLAAENPLALETMRARFRDAIARGLWRPRRNTAALLLDAAA